MENRMDGKAVHQAVSVMVLAALAAGVLMLSKKYCYVRMPDFRILASSLVTALSVNIIKALRMYVILFGTVFSFYDFLHVFLKTSVLNMILPYKSGEIFRGYYLGRLIHSYPKGCIMAVLDRFADTLGIISVSIFSNIILHKELGSIFIVLTGLSAAMIAVYYLFRPLYYYWNHFLVFRKNSENTIRALHFLECCNSTFLSLDYIIRGRFGILYILSLAAWMIEAANIYFAAGESMAVERYLSDILSGRPNEGYFFFLVFSVIFFALAELWIVIRKRRKNEDHHSL